MRQSTDLPQFTLDDRKLETLFFSKTSDGRFAVGEAEFAAPKSAQRLSVARRLNGDWYAEVTGSDYCRSALGDTASMAITAAFQKAA